MLEKLNSMAEGRAYWLAIISLGVALLGAALVFQYVLDEPPCLLCIHVRLLITCAMLVAIAALLLRRSRLALAACHALNTFIMAVLFERSWLLLGTERGTIIASCGFDLGLPGWLALDQWFPALFEVQASCGYTPELLFGITMAEALVVLSALLVLISATLTVALFLRKR